MTWRGKCSSCRTYLTDQHVYYAGTCKRGHRICEGCVVEWDGRKYGYGENCPCCRRIETRSKKMKPRAVARLRQLASESRMLMPPRADTLI